MSHPTAFPPPPPGWGQPAPDPGPIPLRPLGAGDLLGAGFGVVRRHLALLAGLAALVAALSTAASLGILTATGSLHEFASGQWYADLQENLLSGEAVTIPYGIYLAAGVSVLVSLAGALVISGVAAACAGADAVGRQSVPGSVRERLAGRIPVLLGTSVVVALAIGIGSVLLIVPGVLIYLAWAAAAPAVTMERASLSTALGRSAALTRGHRGRVLGVTLLVVLVAFGIRVVVSSLALAAAGTVGPVTSLLVSDLISVIVSAFTTAWVGAVIAMLYVDIRVRSENLGPALRAFAAADRSRATGGPALGQV